MSRHPLRHRGTVPLEESALPLYLLWCRAQHRSVNRFEFITWVTDRTRVATRAGGDIEEVKAAVLAGIRAELDVIAMSSAGPPLFGGYCLACAEGIANDIASDMTSDMASDIAAAIDDAGAA